MRDLFATRRPWPVRHPFACLWLLLIAFCAVGEIDYRVARDRAQARERESAPQHDCTRPRARSPGETPEACAELQRGQPRKVRRAI